MFNFVSSVFELALIIGGFGGVWEGWVGGALQIRRRRLREMKTLIFFLNINQVAYKFIFYIPTIISAF